MAVLMDTHDRVAEWLSELEVLDSWTEPVHVGDRAAFSLVAESEMQAMADVDFVSNVVVSSVTLGSVAERPSWGEIMSRQTSIFGAWRAAGVLVEGRVGDGPPITQNHIVFEHDDVQLVYAVFSCASQLLDEHKTYFKVVTEYLLESLDASLS